MAGKLHSMDIRCKIIQSNRIKFKCFINKYLYDIKQKKTIATAVRLSDRLLVIKHTKNIKARISKAHTPKSDLYGWRSVHMIINQLKNNKINCFFKISNKIVVSVVI